MRILHLTGLILTINPWIPTTYALVDYSEPEPSEAPVVKSAPSRPRTRSVRRAGGQKQSSGGMGLGTISLETSYQSVDVQVANAQGVEKYGVMGVAAKVDTPYNFYLTADYWQAKVTDSLEGQGGENQKGNPSLRLGLKWFETGGKNDFTRADFVLGLSMGATGSELAHSRDDRIFGLQTFKKFYTMILMFGGEIRDTGSPEQPGHMAIGNITGLTASLGWIVSNDIKMALTASRYQVNEADAGLAGGLQESVAFSSLVPKLSLNLLPMLTLDFYAVFRTKKPSLKFGQDLTNAKLLDIPGAYGNSIGAGFGFSL